MALTTFATLARTMARVLVRTLRQVSYLNVITLCHEHRQGCQCHVQVQLQHLTGRALVFTRSTCNSSTNQISNPRVKYSKVNYGRETYQKCSYRYGCLWQIKSHEHRYEVQENAWKQVFIFMVYEGDEHACSGSLLMLIK